MIIRQGIYLRIIAIFIKIYNTMLVLWRRGDWALIEINLVELGIGNPKDLPIVKEVLYILKPEPLGFLHEHKTG